LVDQIHVGLHFVEGCEHYEGFLLTHEIVIDESLHDGTQTRNGDAPELRRPTQLEEVGAALPATRYGFVGVAERHRVEDVRCDGLLESPHVILDVHGLEIAVDL
jgi:hypothetical protein